LLLHLSAGTHVTREIRTGGVLAGEAPAFTFTAGPLAGAGPPVGNDQPELPEPPALPVAGVPPAPAADHAGAARQRRHVASAANVAAKRLDRLWVRVCGTFSSAQSKISICAGRPGSPTRRDATLSV
jgi:hypothetical protein